MRFQPRSLRMALLLAVIPVTSTCATARDQVLFTGQPARYLSCPVTDPPGQTQFPVGNGGGVLRHGQHELRVTRGALRRDVTVTLADVAGDSVGVRIDTQNEPFEVPVEIMIVARCQGSLPAGDWKIWRHRQGHEPEELPTRRTGNVFRATFERHSGFIIASRT